LRVALATNVLAYAEGVNGKSRQDEAIALLRTIPRGQLVVPVQVLGELFNVLTRKLGRSREDAKNAILTWRDSVRTVDTSSEVMLVATNLARDHQLGIWDAVILSAAFASGCRLLLSEDLSTGFTWAGVTVVNPFAAERHPLLEALLSKQ
jgi:predicted nucleic acid-binding protein